MPEVAVGLPGDQARRIPTVCAAQHPVSNMCQITLKSSELTRVKGKTRASNSMIANPSKTDAIFYLTEYTALLSRRPLMP